MSSKVAYYVQNHIPGQSVGESSHSNDQRSAQNPGPADVVNASQVYPEHGEKEKKKWWVWAYTHPPPPLLEGDYSLPGHSWRHG